MGKDGKKVSKDHSHQTPNMKFADNKRFKCLDFFSAERMQSIIKVVIFLQLLCFLYLCRRMSMSHESMALFFWVAGWYCNHALQVKPHKLQPALREFINKFYFHRQRKVTRIRIIWKRGSSKHCWLARLVYTSRNFNLFSAPLNQQHISWRETRCVALVPKLQKNGMHFGKTNIHPVH